jgi:hypothetical protein
VGFQLSFMATLGLVLYAGLLTGVFVRLADRRFPQETGIQPVMAEAGHALDLGGGARLRVLASGPRGAVLLMEWGSFRALLPVGIDFDTLEELQNDPSLGEVTAVLLAESGYAPANPPQWIEKLSPQVMLLLSVAAGDREGWRQWKATICCAPTGTAGLS